MVPHSNRGAARSVQHEQNDSRRTLPPIPTDMGRDVLVENNAEIRHAEATIDKPKTRPASVKRTVCIPRGRSSTMRRKRNQELLPSPLRSSPLGEVNLPRMTSLQRELRKRSFVSSPRIEEIDDPPRPKLSLATNLRRKENEFRLTPIEVDLGVLAVIASMPESPPKRPSGSKVRRPSTAAFSFRSRNPSLSTFELHSGSLIAVITPEQSAWQRSMYMPGKIRIHGGMSCRISSVLSPMNMFLESAVESPQSQVSEEAVLTDIAQFFDSFGNGFTSHTVNTGLDEFWIERRVVTPQFSFTNVEWPNSAPSHMQPCSSRMDSLVERQGSYAEKVSFDYSARDSNEWQTRKLDVQQLFSSTRQSSDSAVVRRYPPGLPSSPLPQLPIFPKSSHQRPKPSKKVAESSTPRISIRRMLHSARAIV